MGEYANPTGYVDTQTGQHFRDLTTNIANLVGKASTDYIAQMKANAEERKKEQEKQIRDQREADATTVAYQKDAAAVSNKNTKIDFSKTFNANTNRVSELGLLDAKGGLTQDEKTELTVLKLSPGGVEAYIGVLADVGTGFADDYKKDFGTAGSIDRFFNLPEIIEPLKAATGVNPKVKGTSVSNIYNKKTKQMDTSMSWEIEGAAEPLVLGDNIMKQIADRGTNVILRVPNTEDEGLAYNASQATIWEKTKTKDGKLIPTGVLNESFKMDAVQDGVETEYKGRTMVNGVAYQDTDIVTTNGVVTNSTRTYFQRNDMRKLLTQDWEFKQKEIFAATTADHPFAVKSLYFNVLEPQLAAMANDKDVSDADKKEIKRIQEAFGLINKDNKPNMELPTPSQKELAELAHIMVQKNILTKQYEFTPILNADGSVKTSIEKKVISKPGKTKKDGLGYTGVNSDETIKSVLTDGSGKITVYYNGTNHPNSMIDLEEGGTYRILQSDGVTPIATGQTKKQIEDALKDASKKAAPKAKRK
jgi:hypothetical protein